MNIPLLNLQKGINPVGNINIPNYSYEHTPTEVTKGIDPVVNINIPNYSYEHIPTEVTKRY